MFDLSVTKILVLAVIALVVFGPSELPKVVSKAGQALRDLRRIAEGAKADLKEGLGPEFADFDIDDLNPKRFVQKHLIDGFEEPVPAAAKAANGTATVNGSSGGAGATGVNGTSGTNGTAVNGTSSLATGERPPYDSEAT